MPWCPSLTPRGLEVVVASVPTSELRSGVWAAWATIVALGLGLVAASVARGSVAGPPHQRAGHRGRRGRPPAARGRLHGSCGTWRAAGDGRAGRGAQRPRRPDPRLGGRRARARRRPRPPAAHPGHRAAARHRPRRGRGRGHRGCAATSRTCSAASTTWCTRRGGRCATSCRPPAGWPRWCPNGSPSGCPWPRTRVAGSTCSSSCAPRGARRWWASPPTTSASWSTSCSTTSSRTPPTAPRRGCACAAPAMRCSWSSRTPGPGMAQPYLGPGSQRTAGRPGWGWRSCTASPTAPAGRCELTPSPLGGLRVTVHLPVQPDDAQPRRGRPGAER